MKAIIKWSEIFKLLERKIHQASILYPEKLLFKHKVSHEEIYHQQTCSVINVKKKKKSLGRRKKTIQIRSSDIQNQRRVLERIKVK